MSQTVDLFCFIQGDDVERQFLVRMQLTDTVAHMKKAIRAEKQSLKDIDADILQLWKVSD
jgi:hypothetical protein